MKTLYLSNNYNIIIDQETESCGQLEAQREAISSIYMATEPMRVIFGEGEERKEFDVKKDDIIIRFYEKNYPNRVVVVKNKDWVKNLKDYNKYQQEIKEQWAAKQSECENCEACCA